MELFAVGLHNPTHMGMLPDGRLLVSDHTAGRVVDVTGGGDMRDAEPFAFGLEGPTGIEPMGDRILVSETWAGRVMDITDGGEASDVFAEGLSLPYGLAVKAQTETEHRVFAGEKLSPVLAQMTEITGGGSRGDFTPLLTEQPTKPGTPGKTPLRAWPDRVEETAAVKCGSWAAVFPPITVDSDELLYVTGGALGHVVGVPEGGGSYGRLLSDGHAVAWGLGEATSMKDHPYDGNIYVVRADHGDVVAVDPSEPRDYGFEPPVVRGLNEPICCRFSADGDTMYVCSAGDGVIWRVTDFA